MIAPPSKVLREPDDSRESKSPDRKRAGRMGSRVFKRSCERSAARANPLIENLDAPRPLARQAAPRRRAKPSAASATAISTSVAGSGTVAATA
jgi:hypothetical protein